MSATTDAEAWFEAHGLPWFVDAHRSRVAEALSRPRLVALFGTGLVLACGAGLVVGWLSSPSAGLLVGLLVLGSVLLLYGWTVLRGGTIARWAARHTFRSLGLMFPLLTRALPLLLLFVTFLFINTEVWEVATGMDRFLLWLTVLLFAALAVAFLLVRLPEEVRTVEAEIAEERLVECCEGTPVEEQAAEHDGTWHELPRLPRANLVLVLLVAQSVQVLLLALCVFAFFLLFGSVAISDEVIDSWLGHGPHELPSLGQWLPVSNELFQVAVFLAAFSALYFTVYAVTDSTYREQFFTSISRELERAIGVHTVYESLLASERSRAD